MLLGRKDETIVRLIEDLTLEEGNWNIVDYWDADRSAIGFVGKNDNRLVYVSCFEQKPGRFYVECEERNGLEPTDFSVTSRQEDATYMDVLRTLRSHLNVLQQRVN